MKSNCNNCVKKDWCIWSKEYKKEPGQCVEWVGETYRNTTINNFRDKYELMRLPEGLCNGNEVCVELTKNDIWNIFNEIAWYGRRNKTNAKLLNKIRKVLDHD